jgi:glutathione S-transferase
MKEIILVKDHVYPLIAGMLAYLLNAYLGFIFVGMARKKYKIEYPNLYEAPNQEGKLKTPFNRYQRGHMNFVENLSCFYFLLGTASLFNPILAGYLGMIWVFGRLVYAIGYSIDPKYRGFGELFFLPAEVYLAYITTKGAYSLWI